MKSKVYLSHRAYPRYYSEEDTSGTTIFTVSEKYSVFVVNKDEKWGKTHKRKLVHITSDGQPIFRASKQESARARRAVKNWEKSRRIYWTFVLKGLSLQEKEWEHFNPT